MKAVTDLRKVSATMLIVAACGGGTSSLGGGIGASGAGGEPSGGASGSAGSGGTSSGSGGTANPDDGGEIVDTGGAAGTAVDASGSGGDGGATGIDARTPEGGGAGPLDAPVGDGANPIPPAGDASFCIGEIAFSDVNFENAAVMEIGKPAPLLADDVAKVTRLYVVPTEATPLTSLRDVACFTSLRDLQITGPDLPSFGALDLSPLAAMQALTALTLSPSHDKDYGAPSADLDLSPLTRMPNITYLSLGSNAVASLAAVASLPNLGAFIFRSDRVTDLSPLAGATKLTRVVVGGKQITDVKPLGEALKNSNTATITISSTAVTDVSPLATATNLKVISVLQSPVSDISPLASLPNLTGLSIADCKVEKLQFAPTVTRLDLSGNAIKDWSPLASSSVHWLSVARSAVTDLAPFVAMTALDNGGLLDILENPIDCATQIKNIWALQQRGVEVRQECQP